ncbi:TRAP transporter small permease [Brenneria goodwinii]|uniref:TRAP transporter small permease n=1 Tax=Brenneria goodwinii TaxID=1109412 RepID=UPI0036ED81B8
MAYIINKLFRLVDIILVICIISMVVMVFGNVVMRYGFHSGFPVSDELSRFCFFWVIFLGVISASRDQRHLSVDTVQQLLPRLSRKICWGITQLLVMVCCVLMFYGFWLQHELFVDDPAPVSGIPLLLVYGVIYISSGSMALIYIYNIFRLFMNKVSEDEYSMAPGGKKKYEEIDAEIE